MPYETINHSRQAQTFNVIVFLAGVWLIISPFIFSYASTAVLWDQLIFGIVIALLAVVRYSVHEAAWASWLSALCGLWMIIAPFVIAGASTAAQWSSVIGGLVALILSVALTSDALEPAHGRLHHGHPV